MKEDVRMMAEWMNIIDERIMEFLLDAGTHPSSPIAHHLTDFNGITYSRSHIGRRCNKLANYGLLEKNYKNYTLTNKGEKYLQGELDASELVRSNTESEPE